ncbi:MAG TPA: alkaline phosphatase family protein, partial [Candidatus Thermoplasmatota archaeon]
WVRRLGPLANVIQPRRAFFPLRVAIAKVTKSITKTHNTDPAWIPAKFLPFFRPAEDMKPIHEPGALGTTSIFDLCRSNGLRFHYLANPENGDDDLVYKSLVRELRASAPYDLFVAQISVTDNEGHTHGPFSNEIQKTHLRGLDERLASIHAALVAGYDSWDLFVCGDHGMAPVERKVNVLRTLAQLDVKPAKDYVVFVNSTLVVFWYLTEKGRTLIEAALPGIAGAHVVEPDERRRLRVPTDKASGDRMLAADPGVLFWPDYFHVTDSKIRGMHGYFDKSQETHGTAILVSSDGESTPRKVGLRPLVDVFPTLCDLLGIPVPPGQEGASLVRITRAHEPSTPIADHLAWVAVETPHV